MLVVGGPVMTSDYNVYVMIEKDYMHKLLVIYTIINNYYSFTDEHIQFLQFRIISLGCHNIT